MSKARASRGDFRDCFAFQVVYRKTPIWSMCRVLYWNTYTARSQDQNSLVLVVVPRGVMFDNLLYTGVKLE